MSRSGGMIAATGRRYRLTAADVAELQQTTWLRLVENLHRIDSLNASGVGCHDRRRGSLQLLKWASKYWPAGDQMIENMADRHLPEPDARPIAEERGTVSTLLGSGSSLVARGAALTADQRRSTELQGCFQSYWRCCGKHRPHTGTSLGAPAPFGRRRGMTTSDAPVVNERYAPAPLEISPVARGE